MKVRMLVTIGARGYPRVGEVMEAEQALAEELVRQGRAEPVEEPKPKLVATATIETVEAPARPFTAAKRTGKAKPRGKP